MPNFHHITLLIAALVLVLMIVTGATIIAIIWLKIINQNKSILKSELKFKELNQSKDKFFSIVAHDLKNPFNGIMGMSEYLLSDFSKISNEEKKEIIGDINIASKNAFNLLQNLLEWTRAQSGLIKPKPTIISLRNTISLALETVTTLAKNKNIEIIEEYLTEEEAFADQNLVATIIRNLATNAVKYSPRDSTINITVNTYKDEIYLCMKDSGIGLTSDEIDKLFRIDINFQKRGTENETGTGLGLKICKEFAEHCNGRLWAISDYGQGSSFYLTLPLVNYTSASGTTVSINDKK